MPPSKPNRPFVLSLLGSAMVGLGLSSALAQAEDACLIPPADLPAGQPDLNAPVQVEADAATYQPDSKQTLFEGNATLTQPGRRLQAERMTWQGDQDRIEASGAVRLEQHDLILSGGNASYRPGEGSGELRDARYALPGHGGRGTADKLAFDPAGRITLDQPSYTTCPGEQPDWALKAEQLTLDRQAGRGTARGASIQLGDAALPPLPEFSFPIDNQRHSGFLPPTLGYGSDNGVDITLPYYFNLAPNYDLTLAPRLMSRRGAALGAEFRYLGERRHGILDGQWLPDDRVYVDGGARGAARWRHDGRPFEGWRSHVNARYVSDLDYLEDLGNNLADSATRHLERTAELTRLTPHSALALRVQYFQTVDPGLSAVDRPYSRLPQLLASFQRPFGEHATVSLDSEYVHFDRDIGVTGQRVDLAPALALRWETPFAYVAPRLGARYTGYKLDNTVGDDSPDRFTTSLSLDAGLFFDRPLSLGGAAMTQTLEPRLYYLRVPHRDQSTLPVFDTDIYDFRFDSLFRDDRFSGPDRVGDANRLTLALSSRLLEDRSGRERLHVGIGQMFHFDDRRVTLPGGATATDNRSATVAGMSAILDPRWRFDGAVQWDTVDDEVDQGFARVAWQAGRDTRFNAGYRYRHGETEQADLAASWRMNAKTRLIGRWSYSLRRDRSLESLIGVEYGSCCWKVRAMVQRHLDDASNDPSLGVLLQLELRGLGRLGKNIDDLMSGGLAGYRAGSPE